MEENKYRSHLKEINNRKFKSKMKQIKFKGNELYYGLEFSKEEFIKYVGGQSKFKKIVDSLKKLIMEDVKKNIKDHKENDYPLGMNVDKGFQEDDYASIQSTDPGWLSIQYRINAMDSTGHMISAAYIIDLKNTKQMFILASGWDG